MGIFDDDDDYYYRTHPEADVVGLFPHDEEENEEKSELEEQLELFANVGLDELELMADDEKMKTLQEAGLDPSDYEEYFDDFDEACENQRKAELADRLNMTVSQMDTLTTMNIDPDYFYRLDDEDKYETLQESDLNPEDFKNVFYDYDGFFEKQRNVERGRSWGLSEYDVEDLIKSGVSLDEFEGMTDLERVKAMETAGLDPADLTDISGEIAGISLEELVDNAVDCRKFEREDTIGRIRMLIFTSIDMDLLEGGSKKVCGVKLWELISADIDPDEFEKLSFWDKYHRVQGTDIDVCDIDGYHEMDIDGI